MVRVYTDHFLYAMVCVRTSHSQHYFLKSNFSNASVGSGPAVPPAGNQLKKKICFTGIRAIGFRWAIQTRITNQAYSLNRLRCLFVNIL